MGEGKTNLSTKGFIFGFVGPLREVSLITYCFWEYLSGKKDLLTVRWFCSTFGGYMYSDRGYVFRSVFFWGGGSDTQKSLHSDVFNSPTRQLAKDSSFALAHPTAHKLRDAFKKKQKKKKNESDKEVWRESDVVSKVREFQGEEISPRWGRNRFFLEKKSTHVTQTFWKIELKEIESAFLLLSKSTLVLVWAGCGSCGCVHAVWSVKQNNKNKSQKSRLNKHRNVLSQLVVRMIKSNECDSSWSIIFHFRLLFFSAKTWKRKWGWLETSKNPSICVNFELHAK